jgi:thioesterase domain-containing protein
VLEKDNDLDISALARANAADILKVQPEGPFLLGGHSYGGTVAVEVALVLEAWGHEVGLVMVRRFWGWGSGWRFGARQGELWSKRAAREEGQGSKLGQVSVRYLLHPQ